jgi:hypothetical protein
MRDRVGRAIVAAGFGPLYETTPPAGGTPPGEPVPTPSTGTPPANGGGGDREGFIPRQRFDEVNSELQAFRKAEADRQAEQAKKAGDFEKVEASLRSRAEQAEARALTVARRAAFVAASSSKVTNPEAAYKLALADGDLADLDVDDDGNAKDPKAVEKIVDEVTKRYEFLKIDDKKTRSFGDDRSGAGGAAPTDLSKMGSRDLLSAGYAAIGEPRRRS